MDRDDLEDMGPIDYPVVEFPGSRMTGKGLPLLVELVDRGIIRILDLVFVKKELDGSVRGLAIADLDHDGKLDLAVFEGASSGLLGQEDLDEAGGACSSPAARPGSWSTRTAGRPRWPGSSGAAAASSWPAGASPSRPCSPPWTPPSPSPSHQLTALGAAQLVADAAPAGPQAIGLGGLGGRDGPGLTGAARSSQSVHSTPVASI
jgi:hypothetical protein